jgi:DnaK suppressor protein
MRDDIDMGFFRTCLEERRAIIMARLEEQKGNDPVELDQMRVGRLSRMDAMQQQAMTQAATRLSNQERHRIEAALKRIVSGEYGYCIVCDEEIAVGRLRFDPSVLTCIDCARKTEIT